MTRREAVYYDVKKEDKKKPMRKKRQKLLECGQCSDLTIEGTVDRNDGIFYCFVCWEDFGGIPEDAKWMRCILCNKSKLPELFSKRQRKKKKPICMDCVPRRQADAMKKREVLAANVRIVNEKLTNQKLMYCQKQKSKKWTLVQWSAFSNLFDFVTNKDGITFEALAGVNNVQNATLHYRSEDKLWEVRFASKKIQNFFRWPPPEDNIADFSIVDNMRIYSLKSVVSNLTITFIFSPSKMYDVRQKYTLQKMSMLLGHVFGFWEKRLLKTHWPAQIYLEQFMDCSEALSNDIVSFTGEVLMECTFSSPELGTLFKPWDTWVVDLDVEDTDYHKMENLIETVGSSTETKCLAKKPISSKLNEDLQLDELTGLNQDVITEGETTAKEGFEVVKVQCDK